MYLPVLRNEPWLDVLLNCRRDEKPVGQAEKRATIVDAGWYSDGHPPIMQRSDELRERRRENCEMKPSHGRESQYTVLFERCVATAMRPITPYETSSVTTPVGGE